MFNTLRSRIFWTFILLTSFSILVFTLLTRFQVEKALLNQEIKLAKKLQESIILTVKSQYQALQYQKKSSLQAKSKQLKNITNAVMAFLSENYRRYEKGEISFETAKHSSLGSIASLRYENNDYFFVTDRDLQVIYHPDPNWIGITLPIPSLKVMAEKGKNGFAEYEWPRLGSSQLVPKMSYIEMHPKWKWLIGTGLYIDDVEKEEAHGKKVITQQLMSTFKKVKSHKSSYSFLFNGKGDMLLHENIQGTNFSELINPSTGKSLFKELVAAAKNPNKPLRYLWDKPGNEKEYVYWKETYVSYFQPLDWYICTSIYPEEARLQVKNILTDILFAAAGLMLAALIIAFYLSKSLSLPIKRLSKAARRIETDGLDEVKIPIGGPLETKNLGQLLKTMLTSLSIATKEKEELNNLLECKVEERTAELMQSHKTIEETRNQLVHQERLAEMGILTAGISHEIKNPLGFIKNYAELSQDILKDLKKSIENPDTNESVQDLEHSLLTIVKSSTKANEIVHTMLAHFRGDDTQFKENSINHLLDESQNLVFHGMRVSNPQMPVSIEKNFQTDLPNLYCSSPSLGRVFVNILHNAYDAMSEKWQEAKDSYDPEISLSTDLEDNHILISIKDNGTGIPDHIKQNIFNPFFTTKSEGKGTGLGLSLSYDIIVKDHRGKLLIKTEPNEFTEFQIFIPLNIKDLQGGSD